MRPSWPFRIVPFGAALFAFLVGLPRSNAASDEPPRAYVLTGDLSAIRQKGALPRTTWCPN
jgi:hypothetical protein